MNFFDTEIITYINQFSQYSWRIDKTIRFLAGNNLMKGGVLIAFIWWAWFRKDDRHQAVRQHVISTLLGCILAITLARGLAAMLPFRFRPMHEAALHFVLPLGGNPEALEGWSSFPSDHGVLFFALSTGLLFIERSAGLLAICYTTIFIAFPRIYLGLHYPTDIIGGAMIGIAIAIMANRHLANKRPVQSIVNLSDSKPHFFYPLFFLLTYQIADLFHSSRHMAGETFQILRRISSLIM